MSRDITPFALRMPPEQRRQIEAAAKKSKRSLNSEIIDRLQTTLDLDDFMSEHRAGTYAEVYDMLESVLADNDRLAESGEQTFGTAFAIIDKLLDEKLAVLVALLDREEKIGAPAGQRITAREILQHLTKAEAETEQLPLNTGVTHTPELNIPTSVKPERRLQRQPNKKDA